MRVYYKQFSILSSQLIKIPARSTEQVVIGKINKNISAGPSGTLAIIFCNKKFFNARTYGTHSCTALNASGEHKSIAGYKVFMGLSWMNKITKFKAQSIRCAYYRDEYMGFVIQVERRKKFIDISKRLELTSIEN